MLAEIKFEWNAKTKEAHAKAFAELVDTPYDDVVDKGGYVDLEGNVELKSWTTHIVNVEDAKLTLPDVEFKVGKVYKSKNNFESLVDKMEKLVRQLDDPRFSMQQEFNQKVNVHVPNLGLLLMDEVDWLEDSCTEKLQDKLDEGWRILAICPQPDQRRPDYILGRTKRV